MRELTIKEMDQVAGGDGIVIPGGGYLSTTRAVFNVFGAVSALGFAFEAGYVVGSAINYGVESMFGGNAGDALYEMTHGS